MKLRIAQFINLTLLALVVGVFWGTWFSLSRSIAAFTPETYLAIGQEMIHNLAAPMQVLMPLTIVSTLVVLVFLPRKRSGAFYLTSIGLLLLVGATLITVLVEVPIDNQIRNWTVASLPSNWQSIRDRWEFHHAVRTFVSLASFGCVLAGTLSSPSDKRAG